MKKITLFNNAIHSVKKGAYLNVNYLSGATITSNHQLLRGNPTIMLVLHTQVVLSNGYIIPFNKLTSWLNGGLIKLSIADGHKIMKPAYNPPARRLRKKK